MVLTTVPRALCCTRSAADATVPRERWTPEQRTQAVTLWRKSGLAAAARQTGIPKASISRWITDSERTERHAEHSATALAVATRVISLSQRRVALATRYQTEAEKLIDRMWAPVTMYHWGTVTSADGSCTVFMEHEIPQPSIGDQKTLITASAVAVQASLKLTGDDPKDMGPNILVQVRQALVLLPPEQRAAMAERLAEIDLVDVSAAGSLASG